MNIANRRYDGAFNQTSNITQLLDAPWDDRAVIRTQNDLFSSDTWIIQEQNTVYQGIICTVVSDSDSSKNGVYWLPVRRSGGVNYWEKQSWDNTAANYHVNGWRKIYDNTTDISGGGSQTYLDISDQNEDTHPGQFGGSGTQIDPYYIKMINGGTIIP